MNKPYDKLEKVTPKQVERLRNMHPAGLTLEALSEELEQVNAEISYLQKALSNPLPGKIIVSGTTESPKYYLEKEGTRNYLTREYTELAAKYVRQEYHEDLLKILKMRQGLLERTLYSLKKWDPQVAYQKLSEKRKAFVLPEYLPDQDFLALWASVPYSGKSFREGDKEFFTAKGERVRSKSECSIADRCYYRDIFYLYEYPWELPNAGVWYPDFTVINVRTRKVYLWEHFGMEDDPEYAMKSIRKLRVYQDNGFWPGENLILTHETAARPLNIHDIDAVIDHYLL